MLEMFPSDLTFSGEIRWFSVLFLNLLPVIVLSQNKCISDLNINCFHKRCVQQLFHEACAFALTEVIET